VSTKNESKGQADSVVQAGKVNGDIHAPVINGGNANIIYGDNHGGIVQNISK
jgi:hypothetical protein